MTSQNKKQLLEINATQLRAVSGGLAGFAPIDMGPPKYSAQWWETVRGKGLAK